MLVTWFHLKTSLVMWFVFCRQGLQDDFLSFTLLELCAYSKGNDPVKIKFQKVLMDFLSLLI